MSTLGAKVITLADIAKGMDPDGRPARVIELLNQSNEILADMNFIEGNLPNGHQTTVRTGLPSAFWRLANQGVPVSKSTKAQFREQCGTMEEFSEVDVDLAQMSGNVSEFRLQEARAHIESMNQEFAQTLFYGNSNTSPEEFLGLSVRYNSLTGDISQNVISGGGSGSDNMSIWLIGNGEQAISGIYPKNSMAGLEHEDLGKTTIYPDSSVGGTRMRVYADHWKWKVGVCVKDWRFAVRIANIGISELAVNHATGADLGDLMIQAYHRIPFPQQVRLAYYMNRTTFEWLNRQRRNDANSAGATIREVDGRLMPVFEYNGVPIRIVDQLTKSESTVS